MTNPERREKMREILKELLNLGIQGGFIPNPATEQKIETALSSISKLFLSEEEAYQRIIDECYEGEKGKIRTIKKSYIFMNNAVARCLAKSLTKVMRDNIQ